MYYSQFGEDKILFEFFQKKTSGLCVEVGANNGVEDSTSLFFEKIGWKCILVEPNPSLCREIRTHRKAMTYEYAASNRTDTATLHVVEGAERAHGLSTISPTKEHHDRIINHGFTSRAIQVHTITLDEILMDAQLNSNIDFISIDVEGHEYEVLEGFSINKWSPTLILIEDNSNYENNTISNYLKKFGYYRFFRTGVNDWYAHKSHKQFVNIRNRTLIIWAVFVMKTRTKLYRIPLILKFLRTLINH
jgi:FkbM family methyltransferase